MTPAASTPCIIYARVSTREQGRNGEVLVDGQPLECNTNWGNP